MKDAAGVRRQSVSKESKRIEGHPKVERSGKIGYDEGTMTHEYEGHYRAKHAGDIELDPALAKRLYEKARDGHLSCSSAFTIAEETGASPIEIGRAADLLELKITKCQLGLFGYMRKKRNIVEPAERVPGELEQALQEGVVNGRLSCKRAWDIARRFGISKTKITSACERLNIRLGPCQLGAF